MRGHALHVPVLTFADRFLELVGDRRTRDADHLAWVDDLGLRRFESAGLDARTAWRAEPAVVDALLGSLVERDAALDEIAAMRGVDVSAVTRWIPRIGMDLEPHVLGRTIGRIVDELGAWDDAAALAGAALDAIVWDRRIAAAFGAALGVDRGAATAVMRVGNVLAIAGDARSIDAYELVARCAGSPVDRAIARFRIAVAWIKRLDGTPDVVRTSLANVQAMLADVPCDADRRCIDALRRNLAALVLVRSGDRAGAMQQVRAAWGLVADDHLVPADLDPGFLDKVRLQVLGNLAAVTGAAGDWPAAIELFELGTRLAAARDDAAMRMEAGCLLGYAHWSSGALDAARTALLEADGAGDQLPATTQRRQAWKLLAVVEDQAGDESASASWLARLANESTEVPA